MKSLTATLVLSLGLLATVPAFAAPGGEGGHGPGHGPRHSVEERVARLSEKLGLDDSQSARVLDIMTAAEAEREAMRAEHEAAIQADICALHTSVKSQMAEVLTAEQAAELEEVMAHMQDRREHREFHRGGRPRPSLSDCDEASA